MSGAKVFRFNSETALLKEAVAERDKWLASLPYPRVEIVKESLQAFPSGAIDLTVFWKEKNT
jgi:hypothetical protein